MRVFWFVKICCQLFDHGIKYIIQTVGIEMYYISLIILLLKNKHNLFIEKKNELTRKPLVGRKYYRQLNIYHTVNKFGKVLCYIKFYSTFLDYSLCKE